MDIKQFICLKEDFFDIHSHKKFLKFVKNDIDYTDQKVLETNSLRAKTDKDLSVRNAGGSWLNNDVEMIRSEKEPFAMTKIFWYNYLTCKFANYVHEFYHNNNFPQKPIDYDMSIQVLRYQQTGHYITHVDYSKHAPRQFSFSYILNDDYEGGEFEFHLPRDEVLKIKPKANSCIMFPSNFIFAHKVNPVNKGTRYAVVGWMP
tara:strand:+ start:1462 stop:2070 length:609 start_codon:yes stop_codon:yes gene_type:complete